MWWKTANRVRIWLIRNCRVGKIWGCCGEIQGRHSPESRHFCKRWVLFPTFHCLPDDTIIVLLSSGERYRFTTHLMLFQYYFCAYVFHFYTHVHDYGNKSVWDVCLYFAWCIHRTNRTDFKMHSFQRNYYYFPQQISCVYFHSHHIRILMLCVYWIYWSEIRKSCQEI